jgi:3-oxoacyl-[acyl-carrier-protein] synthase-3
MKISYYLPEKILDNAALAAAHPDWDVERLQAKTGVVKRHIVSEDEDALDLAQKAAARLFLRMHTAISR